jgi:hypothetical protein
LNNALTRFTSYSLRVKASKYAVFLIVFGTSLFALPQSAMSACVTSAQAATIAAAIEPTAQGETPTVTTLETCGGDDVSYQVPITTAITYDGVQYDRVYATTNSVITFGQPDGTYWTYPATPSISIQSMDWVVYPNQRNDEHLIISGSDGGFQVDISARPIFLQSAPETTNIVITAAINTDGTVAISYVMSGADYTNYNWARTGARLNDGTVVPLEEANITRVEEAPVLTPEPVPSSTPTVEPSASPSPSDGSTATASPSPSVEPETTPLPSPSPESSQSPSPTPTPEPNPEPSSTPSPVPTVEPEPTPAPAPQPVPQPEPQPQPEPAPAPAPAPRPEPIVIPDPPPLPVEPPPAVEPEPEEPPVVEEPAPEPPPEAPEAPPAPAEEPPAPAPEPVEEPSPPVNEEEPPVPPVVEEQSEPTESTLPEPSPEPLQPSVPDTAPEPPSVHSVDLESLAPSTPVELDNGVVVTAEVAIAVALLQDPAALLQEIFTDPGAALAAIGNVGADLPPEVRETAEEVIVSAIIAGGVATQAAAGAAATAAYRRKP